MQQEIGSGAHFTTPRPPTPDMYKTAVGQGRNERTRQTSTVSSPKLEDKNKEMVKSSSAEPLPKLGYAKAAEVKSINFTIQDKGKKKKKEFQMTRFTELKLPDKTAKGRGTWSKKELRGKNELEQSQTVETRDGDFVLLPPKDK